MTEYSADLAQVARDFAGDAVARLPDPNVAPPPRVAMAPTPRGAPC